MTGAFALAGWHFSQNPTTNNGEGRVAKAPNSEPWHTGGTAAYQYHPGGDPSKGKKDAPSALNEVIIPNVNLPRVSEIGSESRSLWSSWRLQLILIMWITGTSREVQQVGQGGILDNSARKEWGKDCVSAVYRLALLRCSV
jgi:hypothetical protein